MKTAYPHSRVLVTGGTGFIGSHLVRRLLDLRAEVYVLVRKETPKGRLEDIQDALHFIQADLVDGRQVEQSVLGLAIETVFHLAAYGVEKQPESMEQCIATNVIGTLNLLKAIVNVRGLRAFVYAGSDFEYGPGTGPRSEDHATNPPNFYAASKSAGWSVCQAYHALHSLPIVGVRPFLTYGPDQGSKRLVPYVICQALRGEPIRLSGCEQIRDFIFVDDVVAGIIEASLHPDAQGLMFNLGTGEGRRLRDAVDALVRLAGAKVAPEFGALPYRDGEICDLRADISRASNVLGWVPHVSLEEGLLTTIAWYRERFAEADRR